MAQNIPINPRSPEGPILVLFSGKPGVGKSAIAAELAQKLGAVYLQIDAIEAPISASGRLKDSLGPVGYTVAYQIAQANLEIGHIVIADCVNPIALTRNAWTSVGLGAQAAILNIEVYCSDVDEHRERVEARLRSAPGQNHPDWAKVLQRKVEPWPEADVHIDTSAVTVEQAVDDILDAIPLPGVRPRMRH